MEVDEIPRCTNSREHLSLDHRSAYNSMTVQLQQKQSSSDPQHHTVHEILVATRTGRRSTGSKEAELFINFLYPSPNGIPNNAPGQHRMRRTALSLRVAVSNEISTRLTIELLRLIRPRSSLTTFISLCGAATTREKDKCRERHLPCVALRYEAREWQAGGTKQVQKHHTSPPALDVPVCALACVKRYE